MQAPVKAIEVSGTVDLDGRLHVDESVAPLGSGPVRVIVLMKGDRDAEDEWLQAAANNPACSFLRDPAEDIYTIDDGKPFVHEE